MVFDNSNQDQSQITFEPVPVGHTGYTITIENGDFLFTIYLVTDRIQIQNGSVFLSCSPLGINSSFLGTFCTENTVLNLNPQIDNGNFNSMFEDFVRNVLVHPEFQQYFSGNIRIS